MEGAETEAVELEKEEGEKEEEGLNVKRKMGERRGKEAGRGKYKEEEE